jgi:hypothetical protein
VKEDLSQSFRANFTALNFASYAKDGDPKIGLLHTLEIISIAFGLWNQRG